MKRIGRYLITAVGLMTLGGAPSLFAGDRDWREDRREFRRGEERREEWREFRRREERREEWLEHRFGDRDDFYRRPWR